MDVLVDEPAIDAWREDTDVPDIGQLAADSQRVLSGETGDVIAALGKVAGMLGGLCPIW